ncbi:MAG: AI-2E family transporter, partial [Burkholderiales bacterium]|nr:AI-2E family transporter [Burkholderiales bacterium]
MPDAEPANAAPVATTLTNADTVGVFSAGAPDAEAAPVEFVLAATEQPSVATPRPRSRGTLPVVGMFALAVVAALYVGRAVLMPVLFGIILAVVLTPVVDRLSRFRIPEPIGAAIVMLAMVGSLLLVIELLVVPAWEVLAELPLQVQNLLAGLLTWVRSFRFGN